MIVYGKILGKARPRFTRQGHVYTPKATKDYEKSIRSEYIKENGTRYTGAIKVDIRACFEIPKSYSKKQKFEASRGFLAPTKKPDADNIAKVVLDALNGVAFEDDKNVVSLNVKKEYTVGDEHLMVDVYGS